MLDEFTRTQLLLGEEAMEKLAKSRVAVFGVGGVGGYAVEGLARSGVGALDLIDDDKVCLSNINRQIIATQKTLNRNKVDVAAERVLEINPRCCVKTHKTFYLPDTASQFDFTEYDYIIDAIDTVTGKIQLVMAARDAKTPIISAMGAGNKLDPTAFRVGDIYETSICPLARIMRKELRKRGVEHLKVVWSTEEPRRQIDDMSKNCSGEETGASSSRKRDIPGSVSFVPSVVGLIIAGEVVKDLVGIK